MKKKNHKPASNNLPTNPDEFYAFMRERGIEAINATAGIRERAWELYWAVAETEPNDE